MIKAHKIRLHPTAEQQIYFAKAAGTARFVWNWTLAEWNRQFEAGEKPTALKLKKQFNAIRREQFPWTWEVTRNASGIEAPTDETATTKCYVEVCLHTFAYENWSRYKEIS